MRKHAKEIYLSALKAVDPAEAVKRFIRVEGAALIIDRDIYELESFDKVYLIGAGKAGAAMAKAAEELLGNHISAGAVIVKYGYTAPLKRVQLYEAGHPIPRRWPMV